MTIDATFWVAISFVIFVGLILYFKIPEKVRSMLDENISNIKKQINNAEKLKEEAKIILSEHEKKISNSKSEIKSMIDNANSEAEKNILKTIKVIAGFLILAGTLYVGIYILLFFTFLFFTSYLLKNLKK